MNTLTDMVCEYLQSQGHVISRDDNSTRLAIGVVAKTGRWECLFIVDEEQKLIFLYSVCPISVPKEARTLVAEYLMRANRFTPVGTFAMDFDNGEIRFKTVLFAENEETIRATLIDLVDNNISTMDQHLPGILAVMYSDKRPAEVFTEIHIGRPVDRKYIYN